MRIFVSFALMVALGLVVITPGWAQERLAPEVMFLIDNSASMRRSITSPRADGLPECNEQYTTTTRETNGVTERRVTSIEGDLVTTQHMSRLQIVRNVLAGNPIHGAADPNRITCFKDAIEVPHDRAVNGYFDLLAMRGPMADEAIVVPDPENAERAIFYRYVQAQCHDYDPARPEACRPLRLVDEATPPERFQTDGVLHKYANRIKFGMMTLDDDPGLAREWPVHFGRLGSFGLDQLEANLRPEARHLADAFLAKKILEDENLAATPNLGARGPGEGRPGDLVAGNAGSFVNGQPRAFEPVSDVEDSITRHTDYLMYQIRRLTAFGFSPLAALMYDLKYYYLTQSGAAPDSFGLLVEPNYARRDHVAILITDGNESSFYASRNCVRVGLRCPPHPAYPYLPLTRYVDQIRDVVPHFRLIIIGMGLSPEQEAAYRPAVAQNSDLYNVRSPNEFRVAVERALASLDVDRKSKIRPLVITPDLGDEVDEQVRQLRVTGYSVLAGGGRYGRVDVSAHGCRAEPGGPSTGRLRPIRGESVDIAVKLAEQDVRTSVGNSHDRFGQAGENGYTLIGNGNTVLTEQGNFRDSPGLNEETFRAITNSPAPDAGPDPLQLVFQALSGFIGPAAKPEVPGECTPACGPNPARVRQLGEVVEGDLIAVTPPRLGIDSASYRLFREAQKERPTLVAVGARDGQVHFFRAADGREVFTFVHRNAFPRLKDNVENHGDLGAETLLSTREMVLCRTIDGDGRAGCPADKDSFEFRTIIAGGHGVTGSNLFVIDITDATAWFKTDTQDQPLPHDTIKAWEMGRAFGE